MVLRRFLLIVLIAFLIVMLMTFIVLKKNAPVSIIGRSLPNYTLETLYGEKVSFNVLPQSPFILVVFASWCTVCREDHSFLMEISKQKQVPLYGISWQDTSEKTKAFIAELGNPFEKIFIDKKGEITTSLGVLGTPEVFVIDKKQILYKHVGTLTEVIWKAKIKPFIKGDEADFEEVSLISYE